VIIAQKGISRDVGAAGLVLRDRYRLDALIASGGMGDVWRGTDLAIDRRVAIKLLRSEHADDEDGPARFRAEAHHAGSLSHPNIAQVFDYGEARAAEPGYLVMELVEGLSLTRILDDGPLPPGDVMDVVAQVARELGIKEGTLGNWVGADRRRRDDGGGQLSEDERAELVRLRRKCAELELRCDVLKRSVALWVSEAMGR